MIIKSGASRSRIYTTQRGSVVKNFVENYLRSDLCCHCKICTDCIEKEDDKKLVGTENEIYIPTFNAISSSLALFHDEALIFTETAVNQIPERKLYHQVKDLLEIKENKCVFYSSEHSVDTYVPNTGEESMEEREVSVLEKVAKWYWNHLNKRKNTKYYILSKEKIVLKGKNSKVKNICVDDYIKKKMKRLENAKKKQKVKEIQEKIKVLEEQNNESSFCYPPHLKTDEIEKGLKDKTIFKGTLRVNQFRPNESFVLLDRSGIEYYTQNEIPRIKIQKMLDRNRCIHDDIVYARKTEKSKWEDPNEEECVIVGREERKRRDFVVTMKEGERSGAKYKFCYPLDRRIPKIRVLTKQQSHLENMRFLVRLTGWSRDSKYPEARYVKSIGKIGNNETEIKSMMMEVGVPQEDFTLDLLNSLPPENFIIPESEIKTRKDMRNLLTYSIDPVGCTDIDDACSVEFLSKNRARIYVHIADVSYFVFPGSLVDRYARLRSTSIYFEDRRIDMLPTRLSSNLCSLHMKQDKLTMTVSWVVEFNEKKNFFKIVGEPWIGKGVINSSYSLHYDQAEEVVEGVFKKNGRKRIKFSASWGKWEECEISDEKVEDLRKSLSLIREFSLYMREKRLKKGGLELNSLSKVNFEMSEKTGIPKSIKFKSTSDIHKVVEELMVMANVEVAKKIANTYPNSCLLRVHPFPKIDKLEEVKEFGKIKGFKVLTFSNVSLAKSLLECVDPDDKYYNHLLRNLTTKAMNVAKYVSKHRKEDKANPGFKGGHYGLGVEYYTHFTSPIRRYPDLVVHRILKDSIVPIMEEEKRLHFGKLEKMCNHMNEMTKRSKEVQRMNTKWVQSLFFLHNPQLPSIERGIVYSITKKFVRVYIPKFGIDSICYLINRNEDFIISEEERIELIEKGEISNDTSEDDLIVEKEKFEIVLDENQLKVSVNFKDKKRKKKNFKIKIFDHLLIKVKVRRYKSQFPRLYLRFFSHFAIDKNNDGIIKISNKKDKKIEEREKKNITMLKEKENDIKRIMDIKERQSNLSELMDLHDKSKEEFFQKSTEEYDIQKIIEFLKITKLKNLKKKIESKLKKIRLLSIRKKKNYTDKELELLSKKDRYESKLQKIEKNLKSLKKDPIQKKD